MRIPRRRIKIRIKTAYLLKRAFPNLDHCDEDDVVYITDNYKEAVIMAAKLQKLDILNAPECFNPEHVDYDDIEQSEIYIEEIKTVEPGTDHIVLGDTVLFSCDLRIYFVKDKETGVYDFRCAKIYHYYLDLDPDVNYIERELDDHATDGARSVVFSPYSHSLNAYIYTKDINTIDESIKQIMELIEDACESLTAGEDPEEVKRYLFNMLDNTGKDFEHIARHSTKWSDI